MLAQTLNSVGDTGHSGVRSTTGESGQSGLGTQRINLMPQCRIIFRRACIHLVAQPKPDASPD
jgi:hypothetical protein